jgi:C4-dicarboxylate-specific signal transduction histidine kinase
VVAFLGVDRGNLEEHVAGGNGFHISYAVPGVDEAPRVLDRERFPWTAERLLRGEDVRFSRVDELPERARVDRASYACLGTRSKLAFPLRAGGRIVASLSFGSVRGERAWPRELVDRLRLLGEAFGSALERKRVELSLAERLAFEALLSNLTTRFSDLSAVDFDAEVRCALARVVEFLGVDSSALIECARDGRSLRAWTTGTRLNDAELSRIEKALQTGDSVEPRVLIPLVVGGAVVGGLVFDRAGSARVAAEELWQQLHLLGEVFANALARSQNELEAERLRRDLAHIGRVSAVGELTASLAHELNQPLSAILSNAQAAQRMLESEPRDLAEIAEILRDIVVDDKRAGEVIRRLRTLLRKGELEHASLDVNEVVGEVARLVRSDAANRHVSVRLELTKGLPRVRGDRVQLQQVVLNLVLNALEAMRATLPRARQLAIRTSRAGESAVAVSVSDSGTGIDAQAEERLFEPLYTTKPEGLGMGLAIARNIVHAHGGNLAATNNVEGGATFQFTLPAGEAP